MSKLLLSFDIVIYALLGIHAISSVTCAENCLTLYKQCNTNEDCCTKVCRHFIIFFKGICDYDQRKLDAANITVLPALDYEEENLMSKCVYYKEKNESLRAEMYKQFGVNAAHSILLPYTKTLVSIKHRFIPVTINDLIVQKTKDIALHLSEEAARELGITEEGTVPCNVIIPEENTLDNYLKCMLHFMPFFILSFAMWVITL